MAGLGSKLFTDGSVLNAAQVNGYLMDQSIMRFATTAARDAAFGGVGEATLSEGMTCYIDADNSIYTYDGSNWVKIVSASQPVGLVKVAESNFTSVTSASPLDLSDCFSSEFQNYRMVFSANTGATAAHITFRLRDSGGAVSLGNYEKQQLEYYQSTVVSNFNFGQTDWDLAYNYGEGRQTFLVADIFNPNISTVETNVIYQSAVRRDAIAFNYSFNGTGNYAANTAMTGLRFYPSAGTAVGNISVYGYR
jgi:hypothetical protein